MRVPEPVPATLNAYLSFRAALLAVARFNANSASAPIATLVVPGLRTGIGGMRLAYDHVRAPARIPSFQTIHLLHQKLRSAL
jgi:hypothetical protein